MQHGRAIEIGQEAVGWLLVRPERLVELVTASGLSLDAVPGLIDEPEFLGFVLDFVLSSDASVLDFADPRRAQAGGAGAGPGRARRPRGADWA